MITPFFAIKLGHSIANGFFSVTNTQAQQPKSQDKEKQSLVRLTPKMLILNLDLMFNYYNGNDNLKNLEQKKLFYLYNNLAYLLRYPYQDKSYQYQSYELVFKASVAMINPKSVLSVAECFNFEMIIFWSLLINFEASCIF